MKDEMEILQTMADILARQQELHGQSSMHLANKEWREAADVANQIGANCMALADILRRVAEVEATRG